ncbi:MAG TPA: hypothetical protein VFV17_07290 [Usitatibacteraceae bacterium]|nr:hypothetical protein [Usitatibacteraceae bacterium]
MRNTVLASLLTLLAWSSASAQIAPNGGLPGLPISLLPPNPTSADNLRLIMPERTCTWSARYIGNSYSVQMANNHLTITLGAQQASGLIPIGESCAPTPGEEIDLGRLPAGNYKMSLIDPRPQLGRPVFSNISFVVADARASKAAPYVRLDYSGHWWDPNDSGWGLFVWQDAADNLLAAWFTYGTDGKPIWWVFQPKWLGDVGTADADLLQTSRLPGTTSPPPNPTAIVKVGTARLNFGRTSIAESGTITYTVGNGPTMTRTIQRFRP